MPRKRKKVSSVIRKSISQKTVHHPTPRQGITSYARSSFKWAESYTSLLMGIVVIIIAVLFVVSLIRLTHHVQDTSSTATGPAASSPTPEQAQQPNEYIVKSGDDLWHIAEAVYGSGYNWVDIAKANSISDPSTIFAGDRLILPQVTSTQISPTPSPLGQIITKEQTTDIKGNTYTVQKGDNLWDIAVRAYADGYRWVDIAKANNLANPDIIHAGNVLKLQR